MSSHYIGLMAGYGAVAAAIWALWAARTPFLRLGPPTVRRPWLDLGLLLAAAVGVIAVGQAYTAGWLFSHDNPALECLNQILIFAPMLVVQALRPQPFATSGLPARGWPGLLLGCLLALAALAIFLAVQGRLDDYVALLGFVFRPGHAPQAVQVLLEDVAIAAVLLRLAAALGPRVAVGLAAALFAAAHIPAILASNGSLADLQTLVLDTVIGVMVLAAVLRTRAIWWLFPIHYVMDMTQFFEPAVG